MWFDNDDGLLPGLLPGLYRGITFYAPDTSTLAGRRVAEQLFPGVDPAAYDDFGVAPNEITIDGLIVGDDYIAQGQALIAAFNTPGPATLVHPWLGPMTVILPETAEVSFSDRELRVVRFSATFRRMEAGGLASALSSLTGLTAAIDLVASASTALCVAAGIRIISSTRQKAAARSHRIVSTAVRALGAPSGSARVVPRLKSSLPSVSADPSEFDAMMLAIAAQLSAVSRVPAVSPAAEATASVPPSSAAMVAVGQQLTAALLPEIAAGPSDVDAALLAAAIGHVIAATSAQAVYVDYDSRAAALAYRSAAVDALDSLLDGLEVAATGNLAGDISALRRAARGLQSAVIVDINETIGRLPAVQVFTPGQPVDAYQLALHIAGDTPSSIEAVYLDILARNKPRHPAYLDLARIEVKA